MNKKIIIKYGLGEAFLAVCYVFFVASIMSNANRWFGKEDNVLSGVVFLLLFVFSAAAMGLIIFGRPIAWYLDGHKREALNLLFYKLGFLLLITVLIMLILGLSR